MNVRYRFAALVFAFAATAIAADADPPARFLGKVKAIDADGAAFDLEEKEKAPAIRVSLGAVIEVLAHKAVKLKEVEGGNIYVLGRWIPGRMKVKPRIADVAAIVVSTDAFGPPLVPKALAEGKKLQWISGALVRGANGAVTVQAAALEGVGPDRRVTAVDRVGRDAIAAGKTVFIELPPGADAKAKELKPERVSVLATEVPMAEAKLIVGAE